MSTLNGYISIKISIVSSNRTKYLSMRYVSSTRLVVELDRGKVQSHGAYDRLRPVCDLYKTSRIR